MDFVKQAEVLFGVQLSPEQHAQFNQYQALLIEWNAHTNLTAITDAEDIQRRHFLDSLSVVLAIPMTAGLSVVDMGAGAGFPGLPLAIAFPQVHVTLMDATGKKVRFMQHVIDTLGLKNARALQFRAEDAGQDRAHRAKYDLVVARAVARLPALLEYTLPLVKLNGYFVAMKGITADEEVKSADSALNILGGVYERTQTLQLPDVETPHHLVVVRKVSATPHAYPRRAGIPTRKPIEE